MSEFLDKTGLTYLWEKIKSRYDNHYHEVILNSLGFVSSFDSSLTYTSVKNNVLNVGNTDILNVLWEHSSESGVYTRAKVPLLGMSNTSDGYMIFGGPIFHENEQRYITFILSYTNNQDILISVPLPPWELTSNKVQSVVSNSESNRYYPTTAAVFSEFQRKPVTVWEAEAESGIYALGANITENPNWQITGLDMSPYKRLKFYIAPGVGNSTTYLTPAVVLEMSLESRAATSASFGHYSAALVCQYPNDRNRLYALAMCVSSDKTSVLFCRQTSLYGTSGSAANESNRYLYKIEGYYD